MSQKIDNDTLLKAIRRALDRVVLVADTDADGDTIVIAEIDGVEIGEAVFDIKEGRVRMCSGNGLFISGVTRRSKLTATIVEHYCHPDAVPQLVDHSKPPPNWGISAEPSSSFLRTPLTDLGWSARGKLYDDEGREDRDEPAVFAEGSTAGEALDKLLVILWSIVETGDYPPEE